MRRIRQSAFVRSVAVLATGTALAQALPMAASPLLTRLYTPADFGMLAVFLAVVSSLAPASCGKYEVALVVPGADEEGRRLLRVAVRWCLGASLALLAFLAVGQQPLLAAIEAPSLSGWILLGPLALLSMSILSIAQFLANRLADYGLMARGKLVQAVSGVVLQLGLGLAAAGFLGLLAGHLVGLVGGAVFLCWALRRHIPADVLLWGPGEWDAMRRYRSYPLYNASSALLDGVRSNLPVFFLASFFPETVVGYYALTLRVAYAPTAFLASSISQVNLKKTVDLVNAGLPVAPYVHRLAAALVALGAAPIAVFVIWGPELFAFVFGEEWLEAGRYAQILAPAVGARVVTSTLSTTLGATENNHLGAFWKVVSFLATAGVFSWFARQGDVYMLLTASLVNDLLLSLLYYAVIVIAAHKPRNQLARDGSDGLDP